VDDVAIDEALVSVSWPSQPARWVPPEMVSFPASPVRVSSPLSKWIEPVCFESTWFPLLTLVN
jgi:hypothetical protein